MVSAQWVGGGARIIIPAVVTKRDAQSTGQASVRCTSQKKPALVGEGFGPIARIALGLEPELKLCLLRPPTTADHASAEAKLGTRPRHYAEKARQAVAQSGQRAREAVNERSGGGRGRINGKNRF